MSFSDEDLRRLKELTYMAKQTNGKVSFPNVENMMALISRLEAAEILSNEIANIHGHSGPGDWNDVLECQLCPAIKAWRKAAGK